VGQRPTKTVFLSLGTCRALKVQLGEVCRSVMKTLRGCILGILGSVMGVSALGGTMSCGGKIEVLTPEEERVRLREGLTDNLCVDGVWSKVQGLNPAVPQDYIALRHMQMSLEEAQTYVSDYVPHEDYLARLSPEEREQELKHSYDEILTTSQEAGVCDFTAGCNRYVLPPELGFVNGILSMHLLAYAGGTTTFITRAEQLPTFLGKIDTPQEAALLVFAWDQYLRLNCTEDNYASHSGGYEIYTESGNCGGDVTGYRIFVSETGKITVESSAVVREGEPGCGFYRYTAETE
jgi:hypothetical protein